MTLESDEVIKIIEAGLSEKINLSRKYAEKVNMHVTGKNVKRYLELLDQYETAVQKGLREKLVKSNRSLFSFLSRPIDKVFTAKGGSINYNLPSAQIRTLEENISETADVLDIKKYLKKVVKTTYLIDPNAVLFVDLDPNGMLETHVVKTSHIFWYENKGNKVEAIIFAPYKTEEEPEKEFYRVIDDTTDRIFVRDYSAPKAGLKEPISDVTLDDTLDNYFKFVPARILGDQKSYNDDIYESLFSDVMDDADALLRRVSTTNIHELSQLYARYWSYAQACTKCEGEGEINTNTGTEVAPVWVKSTCSSCGGDGQKRRTSPSDEIVLSVPQIDEPTIAPHVAGYVSPDIEIAKFYNQLIDMDSKKMFQSMWGTTYEQSGKRETATGRWLDKQPVEDKLRDISYTFSKFHAFMIDCYAKVLLQNPRYVCSVSYGTRYSLESPDDILTKYMEASRENISELGIMDMRNRYFEAEYENDPIEYKKKVKLANLEPFPTMKVADVMKIEGISDDDKLRKLYYSSWVSSLSEAQKIIGTEEQLSASLNQYISNKSLINTTNNGETN